MGVIYRASFEDNSRDIVHWRTKGSKNGVRLWQNEDGSYTEAGRNSKPGGRYNASENHRTERRAVGTGEYAERKRSQTGLRQGLNSYGDLAAAARDLKNGDMTAGQAFKVYGTSALKYMAIGAGAAALTGAAAYGAYNLAKFQGMDPSTWNLNAFGQLGQNIDTGVNNFRSNASDFVNATKQEFEPFVKDAQYGIKNAVKGAKEGINNTLENVKADAAYAKNRFDDSAFGLKVNTAISDVNNGINRIGRDASEFVNATKQEFEPFVKDATMGIKNAVNGAKDNVSTAVQNARDKFADTGIADKLRDIEGYGLAAQKTVGQKANDLLGKAETYGTQFINNAKEDISTGWRNASDAIKNGTQGFGSVGKAGTAVDNAKYYAQNAADNLANGAAQGISRGVNKVGETAADLRETARAAAQDAEPFIADAKYGVKNALNNAKNTINTARVDAMDRAAFGNPEPSSNFITNAINNATKAAENGGGLSGLIGNLTSNVGNAAGATKSEIQNAYNSIMSKLGVNSNADSNVSFPKFGVKNGNLGNGVFSASPVTRSITSDVAKNQSTGVQNAARTAYDASYKGGNTYQNAESALNRVASNAGSTANNQSWIGRMNAADAASTGTVNTPLSEAVQLAREVGVPEDQILSSIDDINKYFRGY